MNVCVALGTKDALMGAAEEQGSGMELQPMSLKSHICLFPLGSAQKQWQLPLLGPCRALLDQFPTGTASPKAALAWRGAW